MFVKFITLPAYFSGILHPLEMNHKLRIDKSRQISIYSTNEYKR
jgi:hypothetical protein